MKSDRPRRLVGLGLVSVLGLCAAVSCGGGGGSSAPPGEDDGGDPTGELQWDVGAWDTNPWK